MSIDILKYASIDGTIPLDEWIIGLGDRRAKARVLIRLDRLELGLEGHWRSVGEGVRELKISEGKGYRIYYAWDGPKMVLLLCGGNKSTQNADIKNARTYWRDYNERK
jgi:putative addiction module killer protein